MEIQVDSSHVIKALQDELANVTNRLMMQTAIVGQIQVEKAALRRQLDETEAILDQYLNPAHNPDQP